jgi:hypothetical protein
MDSGVQLMDATDIAAAALKPDGRGPCNCRKATKNAKPHSKCPKCRGTGTLTACEDCGGSGWNAKKQGVCSLCQGHGYR